MQSSRVGNEGPCILRLAVGSQDLSPAYCSHEERIKDSCGGKAAREGMNSAAKVCVYTGISDLLYIGTCIT